MVSKGAKRFPDKIMLRQKGGAGWKFEENTSGPGRILRFVVVGSIGFVVDAGVLTLRIPVAEKAKPRRIEISANGQQRQEINA